VPITRAAAYHAGFKLWTRDDFIPEEYNDSVREQALDIVMEIFMGSLELTRKQLESRGIIALALRRWGRAENQSADME
jgi:5'-3' exonuclease